MMVMRVRALKTERPYSGRASRVEEDAAQL
jgi:hypothetical protein